MHKLFVHVLYDEIKIDGPYMTGRTLLFRTVEFWLAKLEAVSSWL
uniref:Uncharacterized protein n=1 Tax=Rhizophora mucronata TaxID=61149 RepID=A0A2P2PSH9_RHIMU